MSPSDWLEVIAPGRGGAWAEALAPLSLMPVYAAADPDDPLAGFEFSVRAAGDRVDTARFMAALRSGRDANPPGHLSGALRAFDPDVPVGPLRRAAGLQTERPDLDFLLGFAGEAAPRGKVYVLRPGFAPVPRFDRLAARVLQTAGVDASWVKGQIASLGRDPAFFALDLVAGAPGGKLYFSFDDVAEVQQALCSLSVPWLGERLVDVASMATDNPVGRLVITLRARGAETVDVTLHVHTEQVDPTPALSDVWARLRSAAAAQGATPRPSYVSWTDGPTRAETLYYQVRSGS